MREEIRQAFDGVHADETLKARTRARVLQAMQPTRRTPRWAPALAAAACCLVAAGVGGYRLYFTPTSVISIDINPSIELDINRFDRVIQVNGYNDDGVAFADTLDILYLDYSDAVDQIVASETVTDCLARDELLSIAVVESDPRQGQEIYDYVSSCTDGNPNTLCCQVRQEEVSHAHDLGLSYGKYQAYLELQACTDDYAPEDVSGMTMREIRQIIDDCQEDGLASAQTAETGQTGAGHHGDGQGHGQGNQYGRQEDCD